MKKGAEVILEQGDQSLSSLRQWQCFSGLSSNYFAASWISWWLDLIVFICGISWLLLFSLFILPCISFKLQTVSFFILSMRSGFLVCLAFRGLFGLGVFCLLFSPPLIAKTQFITGGPVSISQLVFSPSNTTVLFCLYLRILEIRTLAETKFI